MDTDRRWPFFGHLAYRSTDKKTYSNFYAITLHKYVYEVESHALNSWKLNIFKIIDGRIPFYCNNLDLLPPKPKFTFRHLKKGIQEFHRKFVLAPADKAANNVVVV